jgi:hypothetical protein
MGPTAGRGEKVLVGNGTLYVQPVTSCIVLYSAK